MSLDKASLIERLKKLKNRFPLSEGQMGLWLESQIHPADPRYNLAVAIELGPGVDGSALERVFAAVLRKHPLLAATFIVEDARVLQVVDDAPHVPVTLRQVTETGTALHALLERLADEPFDLVNARALKIDCIDNSAQRVLLLRVHHIVVDLISLQLVVGDLIAAHVGGLGALDDARAPAAPSYRDHVVNEARWLASDDARAQLAYWRSVFPEAGEPTRLAGDARPLSAARATAQRYVKRGFTLDEAASARLKACARASGVTPYVLFLTLYASLLERYLDTDAFYVLCPVSDRSSSDWYRVAGYFANLATLRIRFDAHDDFVARLQSVRRASVDMISHSHYPFKKLVEAIDGESAIGRFGFSNVSFIWDKFDHGARLREGAVLPGGFGTVLYAEQRGAISDFSLVVVDDEQTFAVTVCYDAGQYSERFVEGFLDGLARTLRAAPMPDFDCRHIAAGDPVRADGSIPPLPAVTTIDALFAAQCRLRPDRVAVVHGDVRRTYGELDRSARRLAQTLLERGVRAERRVGICMQRSVDHVCAILAVLKAGGAYVPLDAAHPPERLAHIVCDAGIDLVLADRCTMALVDTLGIAALDIDALTVADMDRRGDTCVDMAPALNVQPAHLAYVIYTSGTTGLPKGTQMTHVGFNRLLHWARHTYSGAELDGVLFSTSTGFDLSIFELLVTLCLGGRVHVVDNLFAWSPATGNGVSMINTVPSVLLEFLKVRDLPPDVQVVNLAGEPIPEPLVSRLAAQPHVPRVLNLYGPTEDTTYSTCCEIDVARHRGPVPIGRPLPGTHAYLLDTQMRPVPPGVTGEVYLGGVGLARGYWCQAALTAERFVPDPFTTEPGKRMYRTGDLARLDADGKLHCLGRVDYQIKLRGLRIELREIESVLLACPEIDQAVVLLDEAETTGQHLVAVLQPRSDLVVPERVREDLANALPAHMVPSRFHVLPALPLSANGKIDRRAVRRMLSVTTPANAADGPPRGSTEARIAAIWSQVLSCDAIGRNAHFFELGGHSLLALRLKAHVEDTFGVALSIRQVWDHLTIAAMASLVERSVQASPDVLEIARCPCAANGAPLSFAQERLWYLCRFGGQGGGAYHVPLAFAWDGEFDLARFRRALAVVWRRHDALRACFEDTAPSPRQRTQPADQVPEIAFHDLSATAGGAPLAHVLAAANAKPFALDTGPLLRVTVVRVAMHRHVVLLVMHHLVVDGWSISLLLSDLAAAYRSETDGEPNDAAPVSYADFCYSERKWHEEGRFNEQLAYWMQALAGMRPAPRWGGAGHDDAFARGRAQAHYLTLEPTLVERVGLLARETGATHFMVLLSIFALLMKRWTGERDLSIGVPVAHRRLAATENVVGLFVNTVLIRLRVGGCATATLRDLLAETKDKTVAAYQNQDVPFDHVVRQLRRSADSAASAFRSMFALQSFDARAPLIDGVTIQRLRMEPPEAKMDLSVECTESADGAIEMRFEYDADLFDHATIERLAGHYANLLSRAMADTNRPLDELALLTDAEEAQLAQWNDTALAFDASCCVHELFERCAAQTPDAIALVSDAGVLTYAELNRRANQLAHALIERGCGPEVLVGVALERSAQMVEVLLAILKSGAAYVPLDPSYPAERVAYMLSDAGASLLVTRQSLAAHFNASGVPVLCVDGVERDAIERGGAHNPPRRARPLNLAYCIYTSGSTGMPKAVCLQHANAVAFIAWIDEHFDADDLRCVVATTSICFDLSIFEIFGTLSLGGAVRVVENLIDDANGPETIGGASLVNTVPSAIRAAMEDGRLSDALRCINLAGEPLTTQLVRVLHRANAAWHIRNLYGPSETTTYSTCAEIDAASEKVTIGEPIANTQVHLLDDAWQQVPVGVIGEIWIGGAGVARGYLRRASLTAERFVPDPWSKEPGARMYRTGDLGRRLANGEIEFLGRADHQVKIRGHRVELGEVEAALARCANVRGAVVMATHEEEGGTQHLVAYVVAQDEPAPTVAQLRDALSASLPQYMVPSSYVSLPNLPLTPNGKVDRRALMQLESQALSLGQAYEAPATPTQQRLAQIWSEVLGVERVGVHDDFFALGGHSLLATQLAARVEEAFGYVPPLKDIFLSPTVALLAQAIDAGLKHATAVDAIPRIARRVDHRASGAATTPAESYVAADGGANLQIDSQVVRP